MGINNRLLLMKNMLLFSLLFSGNCCRGTKSTGWSQTWKTWKTGEFEKLSKSQRKLREISIFEEKPGNSGKM